MNHSPRVLVVGAGMSGLALAAKLRQAGHRNIAVYEKAEQVGGTWRENRYPGVRCDVPSRLYSFSFAPDPEWREVFAEGRDIQEYLLRTVDRLGLREHLNLAAEVVSCRWVDGAWRTLGAAVVDDGSQRRLVSALVRAHLRLAVRDRELRRRLTPPDKPMCRRLITSTGFYPAVQRPDVDLVTEGIRYVDRTGIVTDDGAHHPVDAIVLATGFNHHAFPNFFMLVGPHSPVGNHPVVAVAERQADYVVEWVSLLARGVTGPAHPSAEATDSYNDELRAALPGSIWASGCRGWYLGPDGLPDAWPWPAERHRRAMAEVRLEDYAPVPVRAPGAPGKKLDLPSPAESTPDPRRNP